MFVQLFFTLIISFLSLFFFFSETRNFGNYWKQGVRTPEFGFLEHAYSTNEERVLAAMPTASSRCVFAAVPSLINCDRGGFLIFAVKMLSRLSGWPWMVAAHAGATYTALITWEHVPASYTTDEHGIMHRAFLNHSSPQRKRNKTLGKKFRCSGVSQNCRTYCRIVPHSDH